MKHLLKSRRGFTLIELLLVIAIISLLAVAVFVALNPAQRLKDTKNARRTSDTDTILSAVHQYVVDKKGLFPDNMPAAGTECQLGTNSTPCAAVLTSATKNPTCGQVTGVVTTTQAACCDLMANTNNLSAYLAKMPIDPSGFEGNVAVTPDASASAINTNYSIVRDTNGIIYVKACISDQKDSATLRQNSNTIFSSR